MTFCHWRSPNQRHFSQEYWVCKNVRIFIARKMVATSQSFVNFDKMDNIGRKSSSTIIAFDTISSIPENTVETASSESVDQTSSKEEVPDDPPDQHKRLIPFMFPTLGDLPGLLLSSTVGAVLHDAQVEQIRNRFTPVHPPRIHHCSPPKPVLSSHSHDRGDEELFEEEDESKVIIETWSAFARRVEHGPNSRWSSKVPIPPDAKHFVRIPIVTPSGVEIGEEEVEIPDHISEQQVVPSEIDAILRRGSRTALSEGDALTKGPLWVDNAKSKESVESVDAAKKTYFQRIYITLGILGVVAVAYIGVATVMFYKHFWS